MEIKREDLIFSELHIHSKYSRACSKDLNIPNLVKWARIKGIDLLGTGDFTHPKWIEEIKKLREKNGIYYFKDSDEKEFPFILSSEISLIYSKNNKGRRIHLLYLAPDIESVNKINSWLDTKGRRDYDGRPIFGITARDFVAKMNEINPLIEVIPAHIWTPWFGIFGSKGGFDSLIEAFEDKTSLVHAIETGISSDPEMNWKIKDLENISILSFSDSHSFWPWRIGREATIFKRNNQEDLCYKEIIRQIRENDFFGTIETDPAYGKYHFDGHRNCNFSSSFEESRKLKNICPVCGKSLTIGVEYRVDELASKGLANHKNKKFFYKILPLHEIISLANGVGVASKTTWKTYNELLEKFSNEYEVLLFAKEKDILNAIKDESLAKLIILNRKGEINVRPGYDGVYGKAIIYGKEIGIDDEESSKKILNESEKPIDSNTQFEKHKDVQKTLF